MKTITESIEPRQIRDVQAFLGLVNFYGKFARRVSKIARPLHDLLQRTNRSPDPNQPFRIQRDAPKFAIGGVLMQKGSDGMSQSFHTSSGT
jgi:hypothetical protein